MFSSLLWEINFSVSKWAPKTRARVNKSLINPALKSVQSVCLKTSLYSNMYTMCTLCTSTFMLGSSVKLSLSLTFKLWWPRKCLVFNVQNQLFLDVQLSLSIAFKLWWPQSVLCSVLNIQMFLDVQWLQTQWLKMSSVFNVQYK